jgi:hypothetical protein
MIEITRVLDVKTVGLAVGVVWACGANVARAQSVPSPVIDIAQRAVATLRIYARQPSCSW